MPNHNQSRFWWAVYIVIIKGGESLSVSNPRYSARINYPLCFEWSESLCKLHSTAPLQYQEISEELVSEQLQFTVVNDREPTTVIQQTFDGNTKTTDLSVSTIKDICINQAVLLLFASFTAILVSFFGASPFEISSLHWNDVPEFHALFEWQPSPLRLIQGIIAAIPMIAVGRTIQLSDDNDASQVNFSATNMVLSLFGRRKSALNPNASEYFIVLILSATIAIFSGISEEVIFRGYIPSALSTMTHSLHLALLGQAILFASGHLSQNVQPGENRLNWSVQFFNGLWYGVLYLTTGGDIFPCIIAHILYDMHTLYQTWTRVNDQLDYTQESSIKCMDKREKNLMERLKSKIGISLDTETVTFARHFFYAFDNDHVGSLSLHDFQRAVSYAFMNNTMVPDAEVVRDLFEKANQERRKGSFPELHNRLDFLEFVDLLFILRSNSRDSLR